MTKLKFKNKTITVNNAPLNVELAETPEELKQGQRGKSEPTNMLLKFPEQGKEKSITMSGVGFPLKLAFIKKGVVTNVVKRNDPNSEKLTAYKTDAVLELPIYAKIKTGDVVQYKDGGLLSGAKEHLSGTEQAMYKSALKSGNQKAIKFLESKIAKGVQNANKDRKQDIERLAESQGDEFATRQRLERRAENQGTSPFGLANRQNQQAILTSKQKNTKETLGNASNPNTPDKLDRAIENRKLTNLGVDMMPGIGDIKGIYEGLKSGDKAGITLASVGLIPMGDIAKSFKPIIKKYTSNTEMFTDILKQAEEQGIKVDRNSKLYKQIQDEVSGAKEYYKDLSNKDEDITDALYLSTKSEQAQKGLRDSKLQDLVYHGTERNFDNFTPSAEKNSVMAGSQGIYTSANKDYAKKYAREGEKKVMPLFVKINKPNDNKLSYAEIATINKIPENYDGYLYDSYDPFVEKNFINEEVVAFNPTQLKSLFREHLGKWDWNNPNIHKAVTGLGVAGTIGYNKNQKDKKLSFKKGGELTPNQPKRTPDHPTKSHVVLAKVGSKEKLIRFGQQGVSGSPKKRGESESYANRRKSFKARHSKNIAKGKMSAAYWANKVKWKTGGKLNQGDKPMEFVLNKANTKRDHTLDGYKIVNGKLQKDLKSSVFGYLKTIDDTTNMKQYGKNLYSKLKDGGDIPETLKKAKENQSNPFGRKTPLSAKELQELKKYQEANKGKRSIKEQKQIDDGYLGEGKKGTPSGMSTGKIVPDDTAETLAEIALTGGSSLLGKKALSKGLQKAGQYTVKPMKGTLNTGFPFEIVKKQLPDDVMSIVKKDYQTFKDKGQDEMADQYLAAVERMLGSKQKNIETASINVPENTSDMFTKYKKNIGEIDKNDELYSKIQDELPAIRKYYNDKGYKNVSDEDLTNSLYHYWNKGEGSNFRKDSNATSDLLYRGEKKFEGQNLNELNSTAGVYFSTPDKDYTKMAYADTPEDVKPLFLNSKNNHSWDFNPNDSEGIYTGYAQDYWGVGKRGVNNKTNKLDWDLKDAFPENHTDKDLEFLQENGFGYFSPKESGSFLKQESLNKFNSLLKKYPENKKLQEMKSKISTIQKSEKEGMIKPLQNEYVESVYAKEMGRPEMSYVTPNKNLYKSLMREDLFKAPDISTPNIFRGLTGLGAAGVIEYNNQKNKNPSFKTGGDLPMVNGVADILKRIKDKENRKELANYMMKKFNSEKVSYDKESFLKKLKYKTGGNILSKLKKGGMYLLDENGEVQTQLQGGERIFSRIHTKKLIDKTLSAKTPKDLEKIGKEIIKIIDIHNNQKPQYVEE